LSEVWLLNSLRPFQTPSRTCARCVLQGSVCKLHHTS
jgi:hypothetical protein